MRALGANADARLVVTDGPDAGKSLVLADEGRAYSIGRDEACDLALVDEELSRAHVSVVRRGATLLVRDAGSKNGAWLGDVRIPAARESTWKSGTELRLGATRIALDEPVAAALAELEAAEDEPMLPEDVTAPPAPSSSQDAPVDLPRGDAAGPSGAASIAPAPVARVASMTPRDPSRWSSGDVAIMLAAVAVLAASVAGLWWLLH